MDFVFQLMFELFILGIYIFLIYVLIFVVFRDISWWVIGAIIFIIAYNLISGRITPEELMQMIFRF